MRKTLGILGGVGPLATMLIGEIIVRLTKATCDQQHIHTIIDNDTSIPDRTAYILGYSDNNPVPAMQQNAKKLASVGVDLLIIPCNTAHSFYEDICAASPIPILHMIVQTAKRANERNAQRVGILATDGTVKSGVYQSALQQFNLEPILPPADIQAQVTSVIYDYVKAGKTVTMDIWKKIEDAMCDLQCDCIILGCTELSIVNRELQLQHMYIDSLVVLAEAAIVACGYELVNDNRTCLQK